jgi:hypothetical protein
LALRKSAGEENFTLVRVPGASPGALRGAVRDGSLGMLEDGMAKRAIDPTTQYRPDVTELTGDLRRSEIIELLEQMRFGLWCESTCTVILDRDVRDAIVFALKRK